MSEIKSHPLSELFPLMPTSDIKDLADDIKQRGMQSPITLYEGKILDGRHRYEACQISGVKPQFDHYKGDNPVGFVIAANLKRRHLTTSQKAMVAASIENLTHGGNRKNDASTSVKNQDANLQIPRSSVAEVLAVSTRSVATASKLLDESPKLAAKVRDGKISLNAAAEQLATRENTPAKKPSPELDAVGWPIPKDGLAYWARRQEVQDLMTAVSRVKSSIEKAKLAEDNLFADCSNAAIADLTKAYTHLSNSKPYAVCTNCQGSPSIQPRGCSTCSDTGLISEWKWNTHSRKEVKEMRLKQIKK